ncbi:copper-binding protein [Rhizobium sp. TRM95796]|uniref:copper-binding protein n=1 Tax=Rhizobium sp. TRM95796 TaxID=2979862 RepID=UPI0021E737BC|nr:copper-binding protein [Rhizobium sp. TRM95796]MCV3768718.1 copper-binding protein [Rhizobium sp. TRM95796]
MKKLIAITISIALFATSAFAAELTKGKVKKLDEKAGKVTIIHEELKSLDMPAMTMVFRIGEGVDAAKLKAGADIEFSADRVNGKITVTEVK